jgi:hypothetical protein
MSNIVRFKENANKAKFNLGLEKEGRSKFPGCIDIIQPGIGKDSRWITGLDEKATSVLNIKDSDERTATIERIKAERESLEDLTGFDLSGKSTFWETYFVEINTEKPLDLSNPMDRIRYSVIIANKAAAPSIREAMDAEHYHTKYYVAREFDDVSDRLERKKKYNKAVTALDKLAKTPDKAIMIGRYLGLHVSNTTPQDNVYDAFQTFLDNDDVLGSVDKFLMAVNKSPEEIGVKLTFSDAIKLSVIRQRDGYFQRGNITLGRTPEDALAFLSSPENTGELLSIQDEIETKRKFG